MSDQYRIERMNCIDPNCFFRQIVHTHATEPPVIGSTPQVLLAIQPWLDELAKEQQQLMNALNNVILKLGLEVGTLQEQIDELWQEVRGE